MNRRIDQFGLDEIFKIITWITSGESEDGDIIHRDLARFEDGLEQGSKGQDRISKAQRLISTKDLEPKGSAFWYERSGKRIKKLVDGKVVKFLTPAEYKKLTGCDYTELEDR